MRLNSFDRTLLLLAVLFLGVLALRPLLSPPLAHAQASAPAYVYIEPGVHMIDSPDRSRHVLGKIVVDLANGNVWGFPTLTKAPYPVDSLKTVPPVSTPIFLGKFDFPAMAKGQ